MLVHSENPNTKYPPLIFMNWGRGSLTDCCYSSRGSRSVSCEERWLLRGSCMAAPSTGRECCTRGTSSASSTVERLVAILRNSRSFWETAAGASPWKSCPAIETRQHHHRWEKAGFPPTELIILMWVEVASSLGFAVIQHNSLWICCGLGLSRLTPATDRTPGFWKLNPRGSINNTSHAN